MSRPERKQSCDLESVARRENAILIGGHLHVEQLSGVDGGQVGSDRHLGGQVGPTVGHLRQVGLTKCGLYVASVMQLCLHTHV